MFLLMKIAIICSEADPASINIYNSLKNYKLNADLLKIKERTVFADKINKLNYDFFILPTKHESASQKKCLTCHFPGNWNKADIGGKEKMLGIANASFEKELFINLNKNANRDYPATLECTHHGPYLNKPSIFIEIGSTKDDWIKPELGDIIARTIVETLKQKTKSYKTYLGIGGQHYCYNFNKILINSDLALSHICPKYQLNSLTEKMIQQVIKNTLEPIKGVIIDWKGTSNKQEIIKIAESLNLEVLRTDKL